jgi:hypothetical protein
VAEGCELDELAYRRNAINEQDDWRVVFAYIRHPGLQDRCSSGTIRPKISPQKDGIRLGKGPGPYLLQVALEFRQDHHV